MDVPILKMGDYLIAAIQGALTDSDLNRLQENLVHSVRRHRSKGVVIDVTVLDVMDSFAARTLRSITLMTRLLGAKVAIVGIQPEIAFSMVQLGLTLEGTMMSLDLEDGIAMLKAADKEDGLG
ncbi:MAG: anti-sigma factor antagonist [Desulfobulbaceae bacterium BRH_c16a]|nr:MAG: anti-sigma factor antagonist [Desulfobulbaceae bacterium BRH_c16a]